jgi:hypothetical protein
MRFKNMLPFPVKTDQIMPRWQRVKERRYQILVDLNPDVYLH